jgi:hypothetical protein
VPWVLGVTACLSILSTLLATPAFAGVPAGPAEITVPGLVTPLRSGGSATAYGVALPPNASCPGDTAHKGYHVFSYLVPADVSPSTVTFTDIPTRGLGLFAFGVYVGAINTAEYTGQVIGLPAEFTFSRLTTADLFRRGEATATWNGGIACADSHGTVSNYWNAAIVFRAASSDPRGFTWSVPNAVQVTGSSDLGLLIAVVLIVLAVVFSGVTLVLRRRPAEGASHVGG